MKIQPHSFAVIDDSRLDWWDQRWLRRLARDHGFAQARAICDLGSGAGHWAKTILSAVRGPERLVLVDREAHWVRLLRAQLPEPKLHRTVVKADARSTALRSGDFDLVSCQTLLMHVSDPVGVLKEMVRLCAPGGHILVAEPINVLNQSCLYEAITLLASDEAALLLRVWLAVHQGERRQTGADHDIALRLPAYFERAGIRADDLVVYANPKPYLALSESKRKDRTPKVEMNTREYTAEAWRHASAGGISIEEWEQAKSLMAKLDTARDQAGVAAPDGMMLFIARTPSSDTAARYRHSEGLGRHQT